MRLAKNKKDLEKRPQVKVKPDFEIQQRKQEHFLRIGLTIFLVFTTIGFLAIELVTITALYLKTGIFPTEIASLMTSITVLFGYVFRRIFNYYFPAK